MRRTNTLQEVIGFFATGVHRVAVVEDYDMNKLIGILSQSSLLQWIFPRLREVAPKVSSPLRELGNLGMGAVLSVIIYICI